MRASSYGQRFLEWRRATGRRPPGDLAYTSAYALSTRLRVPGRGRRGSRTETAGPRRRAARR